MEIRKKNMYSEIWLIAYESDKNKWLNTGGNELDQFVEARKNGFFKQLKNKSVDFYKSDYEYDLIQSANYKNNIYVTYRELIEILGNFKESILENKLDILDESEYEKYLEEVYELAREHISSLDNY